MLTLQRTLSFGYLTQRWIRALLVVLVIALGVATVVATRILNQNLNSAARASINPLADLFDLVFLNGQAGIPRSLVKEFQPERSEPSSYRSAIDSIYPLIFGRVAVPRLANRSIMLLGIEPGSGKETPQSLQDLPGDFEIEWLGDKNHRAAEIASAMLRGQIPVFLSKDLARDLGIGAESSRLNHQAVSFTLKMAGLEKNASAIGIVSSRNPASLPERDVVVMPGTSASAFIYPHRPDFVTQIYVKLKPGSDRETIRSTLQKQIGSSVIVQTVQQTHDKVQDITAGLELGFNIGSIGALVVGLFLVFNALSVSVAERRHDIGILRSVGATRGQIGMLFLVEALLLGFIGSVLGLPVGYLLAWLAMGPIRRLISDSFLMMNGATLDLDLKTMVIAVLAGLITTAFASLIPALQASREEPAEVVRRTPIGVSWILRLFQILICLVLIGLGIACVAWRESLPLRYGTFAGIVFILLAGLLATPLLAVVAGKCIQPFFRFFLGLEGRLAADNLARSPGRTGLVIAALASTGALMVQTAGFIRSSEEAVLRHLEDAVAADLFITSGSSLNRPGFAMPTHESFKQRILEIPEVDAVLSIRFQAMNFRNRLALMLALDGRAFEHATSATSLIRNLSQKYPRFLEDGTCLVSENFAELYKVKPGDRISVNGLKGPVNLEVLGSIVDYTWNRGTIIVNRDWFTREYRDHFVDIFDVYLKHPEQPAASEDLRRSVLATLSDRFQKSDGIHGMTRIDLRGAITSNLRNIYSLAYAQQSVVGLVALLGVISALLISILQRRREFGLMRAVGANQSQILRSVLAEAILMGLIGAILGFMIGLILEWYVIKVILLDEAGFVFDLRVPWLEAVIVMGLSVLTATVVGLWPAYQATQIRIAEAIAYE